VAGPRPLNNRRADGISLTAGFHPTGGEMMGSLKRGGPAALLIALLLAALVVAGCGGGGSSSSSGDSSGGSSESSGEGSAGSEGGESSALVAEAQKTTEELLERPTQIPVTQPVGKPIPKGKTIAVMRCGFPGCIPLVETIEKASQSLGWNVETVNTGLTPEEVKTGWDTAVRNEPDGVATIVFESSLFESELAELEAKNTPVVDCCVPQAPGHGLDLVVNALHNGETIGKAMANYVVGSREGNVHPLAVEVGGLPIATTVNDAFKKEFARLDPGQEVDDLVVPSTAAGKEAPSMIVGYLRSHPEVDLIVLSETSIVQGLPAALKAAGIETAIFGEGSDPTVYEYIRTGQMEGSVAFDPVGVGYLMVDGMARLLAGVSVEPSNVDLPDWVLTEENIPEGESFPVVPDTEEQFEKLWGLK
jgi:ribose transport system substrate-binding protein